MKMTTLQKIWKILYEFKEIIYITLIILILYFLNSQIRDSSTSFNPYDYDTITKIYRDAYNREHAKNTILTKEYIKNLAKYNTQYAELDSLIKTYKRSEVKHPGFTAIFAKSTTSITGGFKTDTVYIDSTKNPVYSTNINQFGKWVSGRVIARSDSLFFQDFKVFNDYYVTVTYKKSPNSKGIFSRKVPEAEIVNLNPYTHIESLKATQTQAPKLHIGRWMGIGFGVGVVATIYVATKIK